MIMMMMTMMKKITLPDQETHLGLALQGVPLLHGLRTRQRPRHPHVPIVP
jgi:hypothetical protein